MREPASEKTQRVIEISNVLTTVISGAMLALLLSYGADIKQISTLVYKVEKHDKQLDDINNKLFYKGLK